MEGVSSPRWCNYKTELSTKYAGIWRFNSTLVQLQVLNQRLLKAEIWQVSIPRWCNYKVSFGKVYEAERNRFNSTLVQLQAVKPSRIRSNTSRFNSTLVQLQEYLRDYFWARLIVSIPRWCNYKFNKIWFLLAGALSYVSIPRWCNYKRWG